MDARGLIEHTLSQPVAAMTILQGGCVAEVYRVTTASGRELAVKVETGTDPGLDLEATMLSVLSRHAPAPTVVAAGPRVLAMEFVANAGGSSTAGERRLAEILAGLHTVTGEAFGFGSDTRIGPIRLRNGWHDDWARFYVEWRLRPVCAMAVKRGALPRRFMGRLDDFAARAETLLGDPATPGLIHGDLWAGNVLWKDGLPVALIDPSAQWADPEFELAFIDLMGGVTGAFWERYGSLRPIRPGFWERRVFAYQVYPLAVHAALFGGAYGGQALAALERAMA